jgi:hypothetical protein
MATRLSWTLLAAAFLTTCGTAVSVLGACGSGASVAPTDSDGSVGPGTDATMLDAGTEATGGGDSHGESSGEADAFPATLDSAPEGASDAVASDAVASDAVASDAGSSDAGPSDTSTPLDTGTTETSAVDTGAADTAVDSGAPDAAGLVSRDVLTQHNDTARTGAYLYESSLNVANVRNATFGKLFARTVDDQTYAQPLLMLGVTVADGGIHDVLYVATMSDTVYAFDADDPSQSAPLWKTTLVDATKGTVPVTHDDVGLACAPFSNISGNIGIESTPVIDPTLGRMFVISKTKDGTGSQSYTLHALDVGTGLDQVVPVVIQASAPGTGAGSTGASVQFDASVENQRASLLLANGNVYVAFGGYCESGNYHGWLLAYDAATLAQTAVLITTPNGLGSGIWMSGEGPSADASGNVYVTSSGGSMDVTTGGADYGEALLELTPSLTVVDWFAPFDYQSLSSTGNFYGSTGVLLVPQSTLTVTGSEVSKLYVNDTTALGHWNMGSDSQIVQSFQLGGTEIHGSPVCLGNMVYVWPSGDTLRRYQVASGHLTQVQVGPATLSAGQPGGELALSANGSTPGSGILWVSQPLAGNAAQATVPGVLQAYDASNVATELWDSLQVSGDDCGAFAKFASPTVANGKVYLPSFANQVCVYGVK